MSEALTLKIPLKEYFARWAHRRNVAERIARMNPDGIEEGMFPRGWRPKKTLWMQRLQLDLVSVRDFKAKWGDHPLMWMKYRGRVIKLGGKRRAVMRQDYIDPFRF